jgi:proline racemase
MIRLKTIDAHAAGEPLRLIVDAEVDRSTTGGHTLFVDENDPLRGGCRI